MSFDPGYQFCNKCKYIEGRVQLGSDDVWCRGTWGDGSGSQARCGRTGEWVEGYWEESCFEPDPEVYRRNGWSCY